MGPTLGFGDRPARSSAVTSPQTFFFFGTVRERRPTIEALVIFVFVTVPAGASSFFFPFFDFGFYLDFPSRTRGAVRDTRFLFRDEDRALGVTSVGHS